MSNRATFEAQYEHLSDGELQRIAADRGDLVEDAVAAVDAELARRGLSAAAAKKEVLRAERKQTRRNIGHVGLSSFRGVGKHFFGVSNYVADPLTNTEEFDSTLWLWVLWLPILPLASYHVRRPKHGKSLWWSFGGQPFSASNEAPPFLLHVLVGFAFSAVTAVVGFRLLLLLVSVVAR